MLPAKLERLPRLPRLRKLAMIFSRAEKRLVAGISPEGAEREDLAAALALLLADGEFSPQARAALERAAGDISSAGPELFLRAVNSVRHILLAETGQSLADWDFLVFCPFHFTEVEFC